MKNLAWAQKALMDFLEKGAWGDITFSVQAGEIVNIKTVTSEKPPIDNKGQSA